MKKLCLISLFVSFIFVFELSAQNTNGNRSDLRRLGSAQDSIRMKELQKLRDASRARSVSVKKDNELLSLLAQKKDTTPPPTQQVSSDASQHILYPRNYFKINLLAIGLRNFSLQYERILSKRLSAAMGLRIMPNGNIPLVSSVANFFGVKGEDVVNELKETNVSNIALTPEIRYYVGKKGYGRGLYLGAFYRYANYNIKQNSIQFDGNQSVEVSGSFKTNTFGLQLGSHWILSNRIALDWWICGFHFGTQKGELTGKASNDFTSQQTTVLNDNINKTFSPVVKYDAKVSGNQVNITSSGPWAAFRTGLCLSVGL